MRGTIILSWHDVVRGAANDSGGQNVAFHDFAHQLDGETSGMNGAPDLQNAARGRSWAAVLGEEDHEIIAELHRGTCTVLDPYRATNPAEFFGVATRLTWSRC